ncbi:ABC transporter ATP-binding protein [Kitasatospora sp. NPDC051853]|uniref:ABC transporter ATP-binding protein n=1 Tax=Kitasatospora sp. NPDC051853 TaxID=3364058 RepID=UPI0037940250
MTELLVVEALRIEVAGRVLVDGVGLTVRPGRVTALLGASGSGKTTTGLAVLGELPPGARLSGTVRTPPGPVGHVPQHPATVLNPARRIGPQLRELGSAEAVTRALARARVERPQELLRRFPHQLSGGQQQRVVLAQALLSGTRLLVADEPTTGQDPATRARLVAELAALVGEGLGLLLLSHDLDAVRQLADEVVVLKDGRPVESGPAADVLSHPTHPWTRHLLAPGDPGGPRGPKGRQGRETVTCAAPPRGREPEALHLIPGNAQPLASERPHHVLTVDRLTAHHPNGTRALTEVSLTLAPGECLALTGRSGSGKTTLGRCLAGLHVHHRGTVRLDGHPLPPSLRSRTAAQTAAVQYVLQDARAAFDDHRPVLHQAARAAVRLHGRSTRAARAEAAEAFTALGVPLDGRAATLSGGELQRAALARALLARPRVLVCDEITSGLDAPGRARVLGHLADLRRRTGLAVVLITHDRSLIGTDRELALPDGP